MPLSPIELLQLTQGNPGANPEVDQGGLDYASILGYNQQPLPPEPVQPPQPQPLQAPRIGVGAGVGGSVAGFNPGAMEAIRKGPGTRLDRQIEGDRQQTEREFAPIQQAGQAATGKAIEAQEDVSDLESQRLAATAEGRLQVSQANKDYLTKEQAAADNAQAESTANIAQYRAALKDYAAAKVNPSQLWEASGAGGQAAMIITAFAHDFLGAKGIKTSGLDSIKQAINNNINAQLENIKKKGDVAQGFKQLWEMQRSQSASDAEARQRMFGFYLQGLTNEIDGKLGSYDSKLAVAKGQAAVAELTKEQVKNDLLVQQHIDNSANQRAQRRVQVYTAELSASAARITADAHLKAAGLKAKAEADADKRGRLISDPSLSGGNKAVREFLPGTPPKEMAELRQQNAKVLHTVGNIERLVELQDAASRVPPTDISAVKKLQNEATRVAEAVRSQVKMGIIYESSGKQINEQEMKIYEEMIGKKDWWLNGDNVRQLGEIAGTFRAKNDMVMNAVSTALPQDDPYFGKSFGVTEFDPGNKALTDIQRQPGAGKPEEIAAKNNAEWAQAPNAGQAYDPDDLPESGVGNKHAVRKDWAKFKEDQPWAAPIEESDKRRREGPGGDLLDIAIAKNQDYPDRAFIAVERLADLALQGDAKAKQTLDTFAAGKPGTANVAALLAAYAQWEKATKGL